MIKSEKRGGVYESGMFCFFSFFWTCLTPSSLQWEGNSFSGKSKLIVFFQHRNRGHKDYCKFWMNHKGEIAAKNAEFTADSHFLRNTNKPHAIFGISWCFELHHRSNKRCIGYVKKVTHVESSNLRGGWMRTAVILQCMRVLRCLQARTRLSCQANGRWSCVIRHFFFLMEFKPRF